MIPPRKLFGWIHIRGMYRWSLYKIDAHRFGAFADAEWFIKILDLNKDSLVPGVVRVETVNLEDTVTDDRLGGNRKPSRSMSLPRPVV